MAETNGLIGHVLFMDIVAFTQRDEATKERLIGALKHAVLASPAYQDALTQQTVLDRFTGDGMALIFLADETAPCAAPLTSPILSTPFPICPCAMASTAARSSPRPASAASPTTSASAWTGHSA